MDVMDDNKDEQEHLVVEMVQKNYSQVLKVMINLNAKLDVRSKKETVFANTNTIKAGASLLEISFKNGNHDALALIMINIDKKGVGDIKSMIKAGVNKDQIIWNEMKMGADGPGHFLKCPLVTLDAELLVPWDIHNSAFFRLKQYIERNKDAAEQRWHAWFGAFVPRWEKHD